MTSKTNHSMIYYVVRGLQERLKSMFDLTIEPQLRLTNDTYSQLLQKGGGARTDNPALAYPITSIRPTAVQVDEESYRPSIMARKGFARRFGLYNDNKDTVSAYNVVPIIVPFEFTYITDDAFKFIEFASQWAFEANAGNCNFTIKFRGVMYSIRVRLDPQFDVPEKEGDYDTQQQAIAVSNVTVHAYAPGDIETIDRKTMTPELVFSDLSILPQRTKVS